MKTIKLIVIVVVTLIFGIFIRLNLNNSDMRGISLSTGWEEPSYVDPDIECVKSAGSSGFPFLTARPAKSGPCLEASNRLAGNLNFAVVTVPILFVEFAIFAIIKLSRK